MNLRPWRVIETTCYPNRWKIIGIGYRDDNSTANYFSDRAEAQAEAFRRNARETSGPG